MKKVSKASFWNQRYLDNNTKWDLGRPTPILQDFLKHHSNIGKVCVLGCGNGYDAIEIAKAQNEVYAIDFALKALDNMNSLLEINNVKANLVNIDLFNLPDLYSDFFDMVYEYTCYCAIDPVRRAEYFSVNHKILKTGGKMLAIFIPLDKDINEDGPPFGVEIDEIESLIEGRFKVLSNRYSDLSIPPRLNREKVVIMEKI